MHTNFKQIMVLNDGETFTNLDGCFIMAVPATADIDEIEEILDSYRMWTEQPEDQSEGYVVTVFQEPA